MELMAERLESVKAGIIGSISLGSAFLITSLFNGFVLTEYLAIPVTQELNLEVLASGAIPLVNGVIAGFSGFLFGVTYRYIIRIDTNPHLKTGGIWAFGLVRGLTQIEVGWNYTGAILPFLIFAGESILWFTFAAIILDTAILLGWLKPFS
ncbi:hypothetical protein ACSQ6I_04490 [Anabaena sp. WFMT]|uniref:hypothetical protein n=1 Tax=Anabaena sp. WFMT TaxID=3449730 RepID=UPI003F21551A